MSLNDPRWGRGSDEPEKEDRRDDDDHSRGSDDERRNDRPKREDPQGDDLEKLWKTFTSILSGQMGQRKDTRARGRGEGLKSRDDFSRGDAPAGGERDEPRWNTVENQEEESDDRNTRGPSVPPPEAPSGGGPRSPFGVFSKIPRDPKREKRAAGLGSGVFVACAVLGWLASGFYIVPEGQTGVVTTFGRYSESSMPGFRWHVPAPVQDVELVDVSSVRTADLGAAKSSNRLREALMLTDDENIVDVQWTVQYRIKSGEGARDYLFNTRTPDLSVVQAAESAMREVVGRKTMDSILFESKAEIAEAVKVSMQAMLDRYATGIEVMSVAIQNAQPPQQVQAAFNDAVKAGQDRERSINLGEAYMNAVLPKAQGTASRLKEESEGYKARVVETATGDADRFMSIYNEYRSAPRVTRDRLYVDTMREVFSNVSKVYVDARSGTNLLYLPLDRIVQTTRTEAQTEAADVLSGTVSAGDASQGTASGTDTRENLRGRTR